MSKLKDGFVEIEFRLVVNYEEARAGSRRKVLELIAESLVVTIGCNPSNPTEFVECTAESVRRKKS